MKMLMGFMLLGAALSLWMFFGQLLSERSTLSPEMVMEESSLSAKTRKDLYLVELAGSPLPVLGDAKSVSSDLPPEVDRSFVGQSSPSVRILEVVPAGTSVKVTTAVRTVNAPVELRGELPSRPGEVDLSFVQDYSGGLPSLSPLLFDISAPNP